MSLVGRKPGRGADLITAEARTYLGPDRTAQREAEITLLPRVTWKGRALWTLRCQGTSGKGPHDVNVPLAMLWHLVNLQHFYCPYHAGDAWAVERERLSQTPRVKIVKRTHPHVGEYGRFTGETIQIPTGGHRPNRMALVKLEACKHGTDGCYVSPGDVREVNDDDQYI